MALFVCLVHGFGGCGKTCPLSNPTHGQAGGQRSMKGSSQAENEIIGEYCSLPVLSCNC